MTFYLLVDVDQFLIVRSLIILNEGMYHAYGFSINNPTKCISIKSEEQYFIPLSINNMINLVEINLESANIKFLNISTNLVSKLECLYTHSCINKDGIKNKPIYASKRNIKAGATSINNFFGLN